MAERPILFSAPMVRAILSGAKTQTRRVVKGEIYSHSDGAKRRVFMERDYPEVNQLLKERQDHPLRRVACPYGAPGDVLWVRETWGLRSYTDETDWIRSSVRGADARITGHWKVEYAADWGGNQDACYWRPSIHMPRWASRITLEITGVRVERLNDINEADAIAEGVTAVSSGGVTLFTTTGVNCFQTAKDAYAALWKSINGAGSWDANPFVWVVEFERI